MSPTSNDEAHDTVSPLPEGSNKNAQTLASNKHLAAKLSELKFYGASMKFNCTKIEKRTSSSSQVQQQTKTKATSELGEADMREVGYQFGDFPVTPDPGVHEQIAHHLLHVRRSWFEHDNEARRQRTLIPNVLLASNVDLKVDYKFRKSLTKDQETKVLFQARASSDVVQAALSVIKEAKGTGAKIFTLERDARTKDGAKTDHHSSSSNTPSLTPNALKVVNDFGPNWLLGRSVHMRSALFHLFMVPLVEDIVSEMDVERLLGAAIQYVMKGVPGGKILSNTSLRYLDALSCFGTHPKPDLGIQVDCGFPTLDPVCAIGDCKKVVGLAQESQVRCQLAAATKGTLSTLVMCWALKHEKTKGAALKLPPWAYIYTFYYTAERVQFYVHYPVIRQGHEGSDWVFMSESFHQIDFSQSLDAVLLLAIALATVQNHGDCFAKKMKELMGEVLEVRDAQGYKVPQIKGIFSASKVVNKALEDASASFQRSWTPKKKAARS